MTVLFVLILIFLISASIYVNVLAPFLRAREEIKMEMNRSFSEKEYLYWKSELKSLWRRYVPFFKKKDL